MFSSGPSLSIHSLDLGTSNKDVGTNSADAAFRIQNPEGKNVFHLIWYVLIGLISGFIGKTVMHVHMTLFWTTVLGIIGSILGGGISHMFSRPSNERYHPAGLILSTLGAILILFLCDRLRIQLPRVNPF
jgi:uncharacterized membrane protein YeaQ/YmgE (transglycosylase-associated protein family)